MKTLIVLTFTLFFIGTGYAQTVSINLEDKAQVTKSIQTFVIALKTGDFETEKSYRAETFHWWNKVKNGAGTILSNNISLAEIGDMDNLQFADQLDVNLEKRIVSRIFCVKTEDGMKIKNRYLFIIDTLGKIEGILFIPPLIKSKYAELPEELLEEKIVELAEGKTIPHEDPMMLSLCRVVAQRIESLYDEDFDMWNHMHTIPFKNPEKYKALKPSSEKLNYQKLGAKSSH
jgi:hypothetical protein